MPDVALVGLYPPLGSRHAGRSGVASYTANLAHSLAGRGADVVVLAAAEDGEPVGSNGADGPVRVHRRFRRGAGALPVATRAAAATGAPVVHVQHELFLYGGPGSIPSIVPALRNGRPTVVTLHQVVDPASVDRGFTALHRVKAPARLARIGIAGVQRTVARLADAVVVHEPAFAALVPGSRVVPHGVEPVGARTDRRAARRSLGIDDGRLAVLCFGFVAPYKGLEAALAAAEQAGPTVRLVVAGGDHPRLAAAGDGYADALRTRWAGAATFTGHVPEPDVARWFAAADVALFAYPQPFSSSGALALALAHGTPVLLSPELAACIGAPRELVAPREPSALAGVLRALTVDAAARERLRDAAAGLAADRSWPAVADRHLAIYEEVTTRADRAARRRLRAG